MAGESYLYEVGVYEGDFWTSRGHPECRAEAKSWKQEDWEEFDPGSAPRPMTAFDPCI